MCYEMLARRRLFGGQTVPDSLAEVLKSVAWAGTDVKTLYMTARTELHQIRLSTTGLLPLASTASSEDRR